MIYDTRDIINSGKYYNFPDGANEQDMINISNLTGSLVTILQRLPSRDNLRYTDSLLDIRNNIRGIRSNPEYLNTTNKKGIKDNLSCYSKIAGAISLLGEDKATNCIEYCFSQFKLDVEIYKSEMIRQGNIIRISEERSDSDNESEEPTKLWTDRTSSTSSDGSSPEVSPQKESAEGRKVAVQQILGRGSRSESLQTSGSGGIDRG
jgi:hypothetical protein